MGRAPRSLPWSIGRSLGQQPPSEAAARRARLTFDPPDPPSAFVSDKDGTELYIIKPESLKPYLESKSLMPVCLHKYLAASMARKYHVLSATAGFGLMRTGQTAVKVSAEEVFNNPGASAGIVRRLTGTREGSPLPHVAIIRALTDARGTVLSTNDPQGTVLSLTRALLS